MINQAVQLIPPKGEEAKLGGYTIDIQRNLSSLFGSAHVHGIRSDAPGPREGQIGDIIPMWNGKTGKLYIKLDSSTWGSIDLTI